MKSLSNSKKSKTTKLTNVKGTIVNSKSGAHFRASHNRKAEVNIDQPSIGKDKKNPQIETKLSDKLRTGTVNSVNDIPNSNKGVTDGVKFVKMKDANGREITGFFKDARNEPISRGGTFIRDTVRLNDRKTGERLIDNDAYRNLKNEKDFGRDKYKGHLLDREAAVAILGKTLGMDHLPDAAVRKINIDGEEQTGIMVRNIMEQFKEKGATIGKAWDQNSDFLTMSRTDKKLGDKLAFDLLIGNTDRHYGNTMTKIKKSGKQEFLAFDQGLSFPNSNSRYTRNDFTNQYNFLKNAGHVPLTANFVEKFGDFLNDGSFEKMRDFIKDNIGDREADAFTERAVFFAYEIFFEKAKTVGDMKFLSKTQET